MSIKYQLLRIEQQEPGTIARVLRDDANGTMVEIASNGVAARVKIVDLINEINILEEARLKKEEALKTETSKNEEG